MDHVSTAPEVRGRGRRRVGVRGGVYERLEIFVIGVLAFVFVSLFVGRVIGVDGSSMNPTLENGDRLVMSNLFYTPQQGDVVIFTKASFSSGPLVKRIVALEGQTVDIDFDTGVVYVDGAALDESYTAEATHAYFDVEFPVTVPEGCMFVMGDNRNASTDSRTTAVGMVDTRCILGKVYAVILPFGRAGALNI